MRNFSITNYELRITNEEKTKKSNPLFLFSTAEKSVDFEIQSRSTRKYSGDLKAFANELKQKRISSKGAKEAKFAK